MTKELTWKKAIDKILASSPTPLHYSEIAEQIIAEGLRTNLGATPADAVRVQINGSIRQDGESSPYIRVSSGTFTLKNRSSNKAIIPKRLTPEIDESPEEEEQYKIVTSYGMFWKKDNVDWSSMPKLFGIQTKGATPVDFGKQLGIYLLYDGREVLYVGRTTERPLGRRLYEHTTDRMAERWDRFSWFGLLPVSDDGSLGILPVTYDAAKMIPILESILIEALEPRQNRKRGDSLFPAEYLQKIDPEIEKRRIKATIDGWAFNKA